MYETIIVEILKGAFYGGQAALFGYMKSEELEKSWTVILTRKFWEKFDLVKALKTVILGGILGAFTRGFTFIPEGTFPDPTSELIFLNFANTAIVMGVDQFIKLIVRRTPIVRVWNWLKEKAGFAPLQ
jgi:hypothetical protein